MIYKILSEKNYIDFIKKLIEDYEFIGPKRKDSAVHDFVPIISFEEIDTDYKRTIIPPAKKLLFLIGFFTTASLIKTPIRLGVDKFANLSET